ncbi:hypothetical protein [Persephonella sp.]
MIRERKHTMTAFEVKREIAKRTGKHIALSQIGAIGKRERLSYYNRKLGFRLFKPEIVDLIIEKYLD